MKKSFTSKLFFGFFPYKITFVRTNNTKTAYWTKGWTPYKCAKWLNENNFKYRVYTKVRLKNAKRVKVTLTLFLESKLAYEKCIQKWLKNVDQVTEPYIEDHIELLKNNTQIVIRPDLIYKKYRYVVIFRRSFNSPIEDINYWVKSTLINGTSAFKWMSSGWNPRLYLENLDDFVLVKLTWGERIKAITIVHTLEHSVV